MVFGLRVLGFRGFGFRVQVLGFRGLRLQIVGLIEF